MDDNAIKFIDVPKAVERIPVRKKGIPKILRRQSIHLGWDDDEATISYDAGARRETNPTKESFVLEFYNPQLQSPHGRRPSTTHAMTRANYALDRVDVIRQSRSVVTFVDPLEDATRRELKRSNLLHPVAVPLVMSDAATPLHVETSPIKHKQPQRCPQCHSNHVIMVPMCKYCKKLDVLSQDHTVLKRHAYAIVEKNPSIAPTQLIDELVGFLYEYQQEMASPPPDMPTDARPTTSPVKATTTHPAPIHTDGVSQLMQGMSSNQVPVPTPSTRDALLELKHARSKAAADVKPPQLSQTTKATIVHYILHSFSQPHGEPPNWTKEQRWDHQDLCLEMLKALSINDVNDIVRAYNAWKHVDNITLRQEYEAKHQRPLMLDQCDRRSSTQKIKEAEEDEADQVVPDVRTFQLQRRKAIRQTVSPEKARQLISRRASSHHIPTGLATPAISPAHRHFHHGVKQVELSEKDRAAVSLLTEHHKAEEAEKAKQILLNAERHKTISSDGMFHLDNTTFLMASLDQRDLVVVLQFERQAQEMFLLGDEAEREALLHLSPLGRVDVVGEWIAKNVDDRNLLIAATRAKGQLLSSDERRLLLAMEDEDCRYHLHMWKHWQHQGHTPTPNLAFLQLNVSGRRRQREEYFRVPRFWSKFIKVRDLAIHPMPLTVIRPFLLGIYHAAAKQRIEAYDFVEFVVQHMALEFGAQTKHRLQGFVTALEQYCIKDTWVFAFCRFCGIAEQLSSDCFTFYVSALQCLQFATPNRAQQADYYIPPDVFYPLFVKKAVMALRAIANDANIDEAKWYAALRERRVLCPRKTVLGSPIYVVGLGAFMDLVLDIWLSNRRTMEDEMRRMFVQFDADQSKSLSYDEFKAFILHCHNTLQDTASVHRQATFCRRAVDEKNIVKLYGKCLMQSDQSEINIDSFVLGGMENPLTLAMFGFSVPPTETTAGTMMAMQLIMRCMRAYVKRLRAAKANT